MVERLRNLGRKYLNEEGQKKIEAFLQDERLDLAQQHILGTIQGLLITKKIRDAEAREVCEQIGISFDDSAKIRKK